MIYEFEIDVSKNKIKIIMQEAFFIHNKASQVLHEHIYHELHAVASGEAVYIVENKHYRLKKGDMLLIGSGNFHKCESVSNDFSFVVFQIKCDDKLNTGKYSIEPSILQNTILSIDEYAKKGVSTKIKAYLTIICADFFENKNGNPTPVRDREFIIYEYFALNYSRDANISELADKLSVCVRQASRLVRKYYGNDFRTELTKRRISAAKLLISEGTMSLSQVAQKVGYSSYSGFWKAYTAERNNKK